MKREELEAELDRVGWTDNKATAKRAILKWHDDATAKLGYVSALQSTVSDLIEDNVTKDVRIQTLEAQLRAAREHSGGDIEGDDE